MAAKLVLHCTAMQVMSIDLQQAFIRQLLGIKVNFDSLCVTVSTAHRVIGGVWAAAACVPYSS